MDDKQKDIDEFAVDALLDFLGGDDYTVGFDDLLEIDTYCFLQYYIKRGGDDILLCSGIIAVSLANMHCWIQNQYPVPILCLMAEVQD